MSLIKSRLDYRPDDTWRPIDESEEADCIPERREALYYTAVLHEYLDHAIDTVPYWKEEAAYQREALTRWVPSLEDGADTLRYAIDQLGYWREESDYLTAKSKELSEKARREFELKKVQD